MSTSGAVESFTKTTFAPPQPDYVPAAGDVVTFKYDGKTVTGIVFMHDWGYLCIVKKDHGSDVMIKEHEFPTLRKFGSCDKMGSSPMSYSKAHRIAKSYFSIPHPYVPAVGDVVEFEYCNRQCRGIVAKNNSFVSNCLSDEFGVASTSVVIGCFDNITKTGHVDIPDDLGFGKLPKFAKAYFATPTFKVGDRVEYSWFSEWIPAIITKIDIGSTMPYYVGDGSRQVSDHNIRHAQPEEKFTPHGTYEERQKQWLEHHGLSYKSMVKVTRKAKDDEDGWKGYWSDKDFLVGNVYPIGFMSEITGISLHGGGNANDVPYFVLEPVA